MGHIRKILECLVKDYILSRLPQTNMEPDSEGFKEDGSLYRTLFRFYEAVS